jgi:riboflavin synthase
MFTGIVQTVGQVASFEGHRLCVRTPDAWPGDPFVLGESVAVDGCCLTLTDQSDGLAFDLSPETLDRTVAARYRPGAPVNVERAMKASDRFGGHIVLGHVDRVGRLTHKRQEGDWWSYAFDAGGEADRYLVDKGSVAVSGVSLTVVAPKDGLFHVALVPHTLAATNLGGLECGAQVNVEFDVLAKHVERLARAYATEA